jgi:hypothetical protein
MGMEITPRGNPAWKTGVSGNPAGRPPSSRNKIAEAIVRDISVAWEKHGVSVLERLAVEDPGKFAQLAAGMVPREFQMTIGPALPSGLDQNDWRALVGLIRAIRERFVDGAVKAEHVAELVGAALDQYQMPIVDVSPTVATT